MKKGTKIAIIALLAIIIIGIIIFNPGFKIPVYFHKVKSTFLSYWFTTLNQHNKTKTIIPMTNPTIVCIIIK